MSRQLSGFILLVAIFVYPINQRGDCAENDSTSIPSTAGVAGKTAAVLSSNRTDVILVALKLADSGDVQGAIALLEQAVKREPRNSDLKYAIGSLYQKLGKVDEAVNWYAKASAEPSAGALGQQDELVVNLKRTAGILVQQDDLQGARRVLQQAIGLQPNASALWSLLGAVNLDLGSFKGAMNCFEKGLNLDPEREAENLFSIGTIYEHYGSSEKARKAYLEYAERSPKGRLSDLARARANFLVDNPGGTTSITTQAQLIKMKRTSDAVASGLSYFEQGKYDDAIKYLTRAWSLSPSDPRVAYLLGTAYDHQHNYKSSIGWYKRASVLAPGNSDYKMLIRQAQEASKAGRQGQ